MAIKHKDYKDVFECLEMLEKVGEMLDLPYRDIFWKWKNMIATSEDR